MGKIKQGILGGFSGTVGNIIGGQWKGISYMRVKPAKVKDAQSPAQVAQRAKFAHCYEILRPFKDLIPKGLASKAVGMSAYNWAMSNVLKKVVGGVAPNFTFEPEAFVLSKGSISTLHGAQLSSSTVGQIDLSWTELSDDVNARGSDAIYFIAIDELGNTVVYDKLSAVRSTCSSGIEVPDSHNGFLLHCYAICQNGEFDMLSDSQYIGSLTVADIDVSA